MSEDLFDGIVAAMSRASIGDLDARITVPAPAPDASVEDDRMRVVAEMLNVLLDDLDHRIRHSQVSFREEVGSIGSASTREGLTRQAQLEHVIRAVGEGIWVLDAAGRTVLVNRATEVLTGYAAEELRGSDPHDLVWRSEVDGVPGPLRASPIRDTVLQGASRRVDDGVLWRKDGTTVAVVYTSQPIYDDTGVQIGSVQVIRDVTSEREAEERKTHFLAMASHEMRTPLTAVKGFADTLLQRWDEFDDGSRLQFLGIIDQQSDRLVRLINDVLTLSRLDRGALDATPSPVPVRQVLERVRSVVAPAQFDIRCSDDLRAFCDEDHLEQVVLNFASNAVKYGAEPYAIDATSRGPAVQIAVRDAGPGVPESFRPRLFERFAQAERRPEGSGTGLGLSIALRLAEAQGGRAWYEPGDPAGSVFWIELPGAEIPA